MQPDPGFKLGVSSRIWVVNAKWRHRIPPHSCHISLQAPKHQRHFPLSLRFPGARVHISAHSQNGPISDRAEQLGAAEPGIPLPKSPKGHGHRGICKACWMHSWLPFSFKSCQERRGPFATLCGVKALAQAAEEHLCFPSSYLQDLGTEPRPTLIFPSRASRQAMVPGRGAGNTFASNFLGVCGPHMD